MTFLSPLFLAGALAASVPILLHLLKRRPEARVSFSAVSLLLSAPVEHSEKRHLRELLLLALRVAALTLLALAFARPFLASTAGDASAGAIVVALDTSLSLSAPGQFEKARALAKAAIERKGAGSLRAVVTFADAAILASPLSSDWALARAAVDASVPGMGATSYRAALSASADLLRGRPGTVVVVTDLQQSGWDAIDRTSVPDSVHIEVADVGAPPLNFAVTAVRVSGDRVVATVRNTAPQARDAHVRMSVNERDAGAASRPGVRETTVPVGGGQSTDVTFMLPLAATWVSVRVDDDQGATGDNERYLVLDGASRRNVLVLTATGDPAHEAFYLQQALLAGGTDALPYTVEGVSGAGLVSWDQARLNAHAALVLLSTRGLDHHGRGLISAYVRQGGGVLVAVGPGVDGDVLTEALEGLKVSVVAPAPEAPRAASLVRVLAPSDSRHPVLRTFAGQSSLGLVTFRRVAVVRAGQCQTLARFTTGESALFDCEAGQGRVLLLASDIDNRWNDFPLHETFLPFVHQAIRYVEGKPLLPEYLVGGVPPGLPPAPGVATLRRPDGSAGPLMAVNVDPHESDPARLTVDQFQAAVAKTEGTMMVVPQAAAREREDRQHLWQYVLVLMATLLVVESAVATRAA